MQNGKCICMLTDTDLLVCPNVLNTVHDIQASRTLLFCFLVFFPLLIFSRGLQYFANNIPVLVLIRAGKQWTMLMPVCVFTSCLWYTSWTDVLVGPVAVEQGIMVLN